MCSIYRIYVLISNTKRRRVDSLSREEPLTRSEIRNLHQNFSSSWAQQLISPNPATKISWDQEREMTEGDPENLLINPVWFWRVIFRFSKYPSHSHRLSRPVVNNEGRIRAQSRKMLHPHTEANQFFLPAMCNMQSFPS